LAYDRYFRSGFNGAVVKHYVSRYIRVRSVGRDRKGVLHEQKEDSGASLDPRGHGDFLCSSVVDSILDSAQYTLAPEHVYVAEVSPDGRKIALFSVKYQGLTPWLPTDVEPYCYVTIVDTKRGTVLLRETEYHGDVNNSFTELAKNHAPWAIEAINSSAWGL
jgi:hypothetical protein